MFNTAIVRPPAATFAAGLTSVDLGAPDLDLALEQHRRYCQALEDCGLRLIRLDPDARYPDSTFVEDTAVLVPGLAILTRPGAASREGEVAGVAPLLERLFPAVERIEAPGTVDGGDICEAGERFFIGISERTNQAGAEQLAAILARAGYEPIFVDIRGIPGILHLKSGLTYLGDNRLVVIDALAGHPGFQGFASVRVEPEEAYAANCIRVNDKVLIPHGYPALQAAVASLGYPTIALEMAEFQKMDGGLSCLSLRF